MSYISDKTSAAQRASKSLALASTDEKNRFLKILAQKLRSNQAIILEANSIDTKASLNTLDEVLMDRLILNPKRIEAMACACEELILMTDPVGEILESNARPNGLTIQKVRVPLGVIALIYESRPNVSIDASILCLKAGNAVILRGGKEALHSNQALVNCIKESLQESNMDENVVQFIDQSDRALAIELMQDREHVDVLIPRGSDRLIKSVIENAKIPVLETGVGNCHVYVHEEADLKMAEAIIINAKCSRPSVCNAAEKLIVDQKIAKVFLEKLVPNLIENKVELRVCEKTSALFPQLKHATPEDWSTEYLNLTLGIKIVEDFNEALEHIQCYTTHHSESIVTPNKELALRFQKEIDAAVVYVNASTRFSDGAEFGYGAEIGISTQKLHARGPMGLKELCTYKYLVDGNGQIR